ncbi:MAG: YncE family protein [Gemmatimonadota bacterium]
MSSRLLPLAAVGIQLLLLAPASSHAQSFSTQKFDIGGEGGTDYLTAEPGTGRVFISRSTHVMVVDGATGRLLGDIADTPRVHGIALVPKWHRGFTTNAGDSTVTIFDLATLASIQKVRIPTGGLDGIMYDPSSDRVVLTNHSRPIGTVVVINPSSGAITGTVDLEDTAPEGAASDGAGKLFVNNEGTSTLQVLDAAAMRATASWSLAPCDGPTGIAFDAQNHLIISGCSGTTIVTDAETGSRVATIPNGDGVDALGWDPVEKLIYVPAGGDGNVTVAHQDGRDRYSVIATVPTVAGAKTIAVDPLRHVAYLFQPEYGPVPTPPAGTTPNRRQRGPIVASWLVVVRH